ncbi:SDR family NAD(P)-dependent oxidoreductase [Arthrobacter agilis]|uniref:SDR family NAD(P)-dependent oxidoreductase n=1 Tax=Arthrobacter agilis TaxID=37921 RepID=UPI0023652285|nr:SDR family NAD(P)-dependent oxidoreductase [Arthrobacter agilis]WDF33967.1 SDR family NAD(P)-dependent oxidoreductase [Arthrobacter agilis]
MTGRRPGGATRTVVVTGGASGIGAAIAEGFRAQGDSVVVLDRAPGPGVIAVDVADETSVRTAFAAVRERVGTVDVLINSAGLLTESRLEDMSLEVWNETLAVDLTGVFLCCREVVGPMRHQRWGRIITIASQLGIKGGVGLTHYTAAKAGAIGMSKALALEVSPDNVLVNCIAPGPIETPLVDGISEDWKAAKRAELPLGRFGVPAEVAPTALLLASDPGGNLFVGQTLGPNSGDVMP